MDGKVGPAVPPVISIATNQQEVFHVPAAIPAFS
jgi:hypothetical protein